MKRIACALFCSIVGTAVAQECPRIVPSTKPLLNTNPTYSLTSTRIRSNNAGYLAYWYGAKRNGVRPLSFVYVVREHAKAAYVSAAIEDARKIGANAALKKRLNLPVTDPRARAIWCPFWPEMQAGMTAL